MTKRTNQHQNSYPTLHVTASSVLEQDGRFLLVEEAANGQIVINQPSGHVEERESPIAATVRETLEETGWTYQPTAIIGIYFYFSPNVQITYQRICFTGKLIKYDSDHPLDDVIIKPLWLTRDELTRQTYQLRSPMVLQCIDDYLAGKRYDLNLITELL